MVLLFVSWPLFFISSLTNSISKIVFFKKKNKNNQIESLYINIKDKYF